MKILQSYWSKPYLSAPDSGTYGGWYNKAFHYMSCALSCLKLAEFYPVELVTDLAGREVLIDRLDLPYTTIRIDLESLDYPIDCWALGKMVAYSIQTEPFIHVDNDIFIWKPFSDKITQAELVAQNKELNFLCNQTFMEDAKTHLVYLPDILNRAQNSSSAPISSNAGILGGNNIDFINNYALEALHFVARNRKYLYKMEYLPGLNLIFEQFLFQRMAEEEQIEITYLIDNVLTQHYKGLVNFWETPHVRSYIHALSGYKNFYVIGEQVAQRLWYEYPLYFHKIQKLIRNNQL